MFPRVTAGATIMVLESLLDILATTNVQRTVTYTLNDVDVVPEPMTLPVKVGMPTN